MLFAFFFKVEVLLVRHFGPATSLLGLRRAIDGAVHVALRLAEDEPYGVRGATIFVRIAEGADSEKGETDKQATGDAAAAGPSSSTADASAVAKGKPLGSIAVDVNTVRQEMLLRCLRI